MTHALASLSPLALIVVALIGFGLGSIWYSPFLFAKAWMEEMKITPETMKSQAGHIPRMMIGAILCTIVSTITLAALVVGLHSHGALKGAELGLFVGAGLVAAREGTSALFESRSLRHFLIVSGYDVALCTLQAAILAVWH
jgi:hypothetical protein